MKKIAILLASAIGAFTVGTTVIGSLSWFIASKTFSEIDIDGTSAAAYFAYGDGTSEQTAFGIKTPRQLYNLAWLQYNGIFNQNTDGAINQQYYFELANDIDMTGWTLPPIGTEDNPFLGEFNGNSHTITGLTVSNKSTFTQKPSGIDYDVQPEIVGLFGVVGGGAKAVPYTYDSSVVELKDVTIKDITVESKTTSTLVGLAAGYINGEMSGVKIDGNATLDINDQTHTAKNAITDKITDYGLVGYSKKTGSSGAYSQKLSRYYSSLDGGSEGADFGGSIDMESLFNRLTFVKNELHTTYNGNHVIGYDYAGKYDILQRESFGLSETINFLSGGPLTNQHYKTDEQSLLYATDYTELQANENEFFISCEYNQLTYYLNLSDDGKSIITDQVGKTYWRITSGRSNHNGYVYTYSPFTNKIGSQNNITRDSVRFLDYSNSSLLVSTYPNSSSLWDLSSSTLYKKNTDYFLTFNGQSWTFKNSVNEENVKIKRKGTDYYIGVNESTKTLTVDEDADTATIWTTTLFNESRKSYTLSTQINGVEYFWYTSSTYSYVVQLQTVNKYTISSWGSLSGDSLRDKDSKPTNGHYLGGTTNASTYSTGMRVYHSGGSVYIKNGSGKEYLIFDISNVTFSKSMITNTRSVPQIEWTEKQYVNHSETYIPLNLENNSLSAKSTNVGYIVSGSNYQMEGTNSGGDIRVSAYEYSKINESVASIDSNDIKLYTINDSTDKVLINDTLSDKDTTTAKTSIDELGFTRYYDYVTDDSKTITGARDQFYQILRDNRADVFGLHFMNANISESNVFDATNIKINGKSYSTYELPRDCIDFNLSKDGVITFFAGTYFKSNDAFFTLHKITRDSNNNIESIDEIENVYKMQNGKIYYGSTKQNQSDEVVFKTSWIKNPTSSQFTDNCIYYFEIPVSAGEYALGSVSGKNGAYLMYLDIGSNGEGSNSDILSAYSITTVKSGNSYPIGVDFTPVTVSGQGGDSIGVYIASGEQGILTFAIGDSNITITDSSNISTYAFQGSKYCTNDPPEDYFSVTGNSPGELITPSSGGERVLNISLTTASETTYSIRVIDQLNNDETIASSAYEINGTTSSLSAINDMLSNSDMNINAALNDEYSLRNLSLAATLTRIGQVKNEFTTSYVIDSCTTSTISVSIITNGTTISIEIESGYSLMIDGVSYADGSTYVIA